MKLKTVVLIVTVGLLVCLSVGCSKKEPAKSQEAPSVKKVEKAVEVKEPEKVIEAVASPEIKAAEKGSKLIVIANDINYELCKDVIRFIETRGVPVQRIGDSEADSYKKAKYIVLLAGPNEKDSTGELARQLLSADEQAWASQVGNKQMYLKADKWSEGQYVLVFAGYDANAAFRALVNNKNKWWAYIRGWFNIEPTHEEVYGY